MIILELLEKKLEYKNSCCSFTTLQLIENEWVLISLISIYLFTLLEMIKFAFSWIEGSFIIILNDILQILLPFFLKGNYNCKVFHPIFPSIPDWELYLRWLKKWNYGK